MLSGQGRGKKARQDGLRKTRNGRRGKILRGSCRQADWAGRAFVDVNADPRKLRVVSCRTIFQSPRTVRGDRPPVAAIRKERPFDVGEECSIFRTCCRTYLDSSCLDREAPPSCHACDKHELRPRARRYHPPGLRFGSILLSNPISFGFEPDSDSLSNLLKPRTGREQVWGPLAPGAVHWGLCCCLRVQPRGREEDGG